jgi:hypothetical protein
MPIILAMWEAEIRRIMVQSQPGKIVHETLFQNKPITKKGSSGRAPSKHKTEFKTQ